MSGFGGGWSRTPVADVARYPQFRGWEAAHDGLGASVSNTRQRAGGGGRGALPRSRAGRGGMRTNSAPRWTRPARRGFAEPFMTAPVPRHHRRGPAQQHGTRPRTPIWRHSATRCKVEYETIVAQGFLLQIDAPDLALERHMSYQDRPLVDFLAFAEKVVVTINARAGRRSRASGCGMHACWGNYEARTIATWRWRRCCRRSGRRMSAASCCRSPIRAMRTKTAASKTCRSTDGPGGGRRRDRCADQFRRASRGGGRPDRARGAGGRRSEPGAWPARIAASTPRPDAGGWPRTWSGRSLRAMAEGARIASRRLFG